MTSLDSSRREQTRIRRALRRRRRLRMGAVTAVGSLAVLGVSGAAVGTAAGANLRAAAGMQLVDLASPLLAAETASPGSSEPAARAPEDAASSPAGPAEEAQAAESVAAAEAKAAEQAVEAAAAQAAAQQAADAAAAQAAEAAARAAVPVDDPAAAKAYAASALSARGWEAGQLSCLDKLWTKESEWLTSATNSSSGAYGIAQSLPAEKMASAGADWKVNYRTQINWGLEYISSRYGTPCNALNFHYANNWY